MSQGSEIKHLVETIAKAICTNPDEVQINEIEGTSSSIIEVCVAKEDLGKIESEYLPPCIKAIIANVQNGINIGHEARFSMVTFLHHAGMSNDEICREVEDKYAGKVKFFTGGSDFHNDVRKGVKNPRMIGEAGISYRKFKRIFHSYL